MQANDIALRWARLLAAAAVLALSGCAFMVPQTVALRTDWPAGVPERVELADVPFFPQADYQCGPASLATVLVHSGVAVHPDALVDQVWLPGRRGSLQVEMLATPRRHGRVSYRLAPRYADLLREVAAGHPVVVLQDVGMMLPEWHYAVVNGYDYGTGTIFLRSGTEPREQMPFTAFERSWMKGGYPARSRRPRPKTGGWRRCRRSRAAATWGPRCRPMPRPCSDGRRTWPRPSAWPTTCTSAARSAKRPRCCAARCSATRIRPSC
jgi:hypothetical protein